MVASDEVAFVGLSAAALIEQRQSHRTIDCGTTTAGVDDVVDITRRQSCELACQLCGWTIAHVSEGIRVGQSPHLRGNGVCHLRTAEADVCAPETAQRIEVAPAIDVEQPAAFASVYQ
jgi:hypothetical protein